MIIALLTVIHILVCCILIIAVLLQSGKGADLAGAFGGAGSQTAFGSRGPATFLSRITTVAALTFMVTSLALSLFFNRGAFTSRSNVPAEDLSKPAASQTAPKPTGPPAPAKSAPTPGTNAPSPDAPGTPAKQEQKPAEAPAKP